MRLVVATRNEHKLRELRALLPDHELEPLPHGVVEQVVDVTGIVLTKLDGTAKGGIVFHVQRELGVPVKLVGLGEGVDDLAPFEPAAFVDALLG